MVCQLDFFTAESVDLQYLKSDLQVVKESSDKVRKCMFARHNELMRKYSELHDRMQIIERNICTGDVTMSPRS